MKFHVYDINNVLAEVKERVGSVPPADADAFVLFNDVRGSCLNLVKTVRNLTQKPVYVVQHGRAATRDYDKPNSFPLRADKFLCWGQSDYERMKRLGYGDRIEIVGCPLLKYRQPKVAHEGKDILFIPVNSDHEEPENLLVYYELLKMKYQSAQKALSVMQPTLHKDWGIDGKNHVPFSRISDFNLTTKLLPQHDKNLYHGDALVSNQANPRHINIIFDLLANVDCVVTLDESTTEILALACDVPVVCCDIYDFNILGGKSYAGIERLRSKSVTHCDLAGLADAVTDALEHPERLRDARAADAEYELSTSIKDPAARIIEIASGAVRV